MFLSQVNKKQQDRLYLESQTVFALPGRKALLKSDMEYEVLLIDASETPIERPKKSQAEEENKKSKQ